MHSYEGIRILFRITCLIVQTFPVWTGIRSAFQTPVVPTPITKCLQKTQTCGCCLQTSRGGEDVWMILWKNVWVRQPGGGDGAWIRSRISPENHGKPMALCCHGFMKRCNFFKGWSVVGRKDLASSLPQFQSHL